jgi:hypothetical protein
MTLHKAAVLRGRVADHNHAADAVGSDRQAIGSATNRTPVGFKALTIHGGSVKCLFWLLGDGPRVGLTLFQPTKLGVLYPALFSGQPTRRMGASNKLVVWVLFAPQYFFCLDLDLVINQSFGIPPCAPL